MITDKQLKHKFYLINNLIKAEEMNQFKFTDKFLKTFEEKIFSNENQNKENNFSNSFLENNSLVENQNQIKYQNQVNETKQDINKNSKQNNLFVREGEGEILPSLIINKINEHQTKNQYEVSIENKQTKKEKLNKDVKSNELDINNYEQLFKNLP